MGAITTTTMSASTQANPNVPPQAASMGSFALMGFMIIVFYFMLIRPQSKRAKEHRQLLSNLSVGDEVLTSGGLMGRIQKISNEFLALNLNEQLQIKVQKSAVVSVLPQGTLHSIDSSK